MVANAARLLKLLAARAPSQSWSTLAFRPTERIACSNPLMPMRAGAFPPDWMELIPELDRQPSDLVVFKRQMGAFYGTDLDLQLRRRGITSIVLCGIATEAGVESTARDAYELGYELVFASDAMNGMNPDCHVNSIERIFPRMAASAPPSKSSPRCSPESLPGPHPVHAVTKRMGAPRTRFRLALPRTNAP